MTPDPISRARALIVANKLQEAEALCQQMIAKKPRNDVALGFLGVIAFKTNRFAEAADYFGRAAASNSSSEQHAIDHAAALLRAGRADDAANAYWEASRRFPNSINVLNETGNGLLAMGRFQEAAEIYRKALGSGRPEVFNNLGNAMQGMRRFAESIAAYREAIRIKPDYLEPLVNMGNALNETREFRQAIDVLNRAIQLRPNLPEAFLFLGFAHQSLYEDGPAIESLRRALQLRPTYAEAELELAKLLLRNDRLDEGVAALRRAVAIKPDYVDAQLFLAHALRESGHHAEALEWSKKAGESNDPRAGSAFLFALNYSDDIDDRTVLQHHLTWAKRFAEPLAAEIKPLDVDRTPNRRLRIGYVSPNLFEHPVGRFMLPLLTHHDRQAFEIVCFNDATKKDATTDRLRAVADGWIDTFNVPDAALADLIREQKIDILIDLAMHSPSNRLLTFARQPAPVQASYLAYAGTTGLSAIGNRLTDPYIDPLTQDDSIYIEKSWRLPHAFWCYAAPTDAPAVGSSPVERNGYVTFGCFSNFAKVSEKALSTWANVLAAVRGSHLMLHCPAGAHRENVLGIFAMANVEAHRIQFVSRVTPESYFAGYNEIDVCFDTIGYAGGTTTFDALWMGVPVITMAGRRAIGRGGVSILSNLGLREWVAADFDEYALKAIDLVKNREQLTLMRQTLRDHLQNSILMDAATFAKDFESALQKLWLDTSTSR